MNNNRTKFHDAFDLINQALIKIKEHFNESDDINYNFYIDKKQDFIYLSLVSPNEIDETEDKIFYKRNEFFLKTKTYKLLPILSEQECFKINLDNDLISDKNGNYLLLTSKFDNLFIQIDYFLTIKYFNFDEIYNFTTKNKVEVLLQSDLLYHCFINFNKDSGSYAADLTPLSALVFGIKNFKKQQNM